MNWCGMFLGGALFGLAPLSLFLPARGQTSATPTSSTSTSAKHGKQAGSSADSGIDAGTATNLLYRNKTLGLTCKIPPGWVLRTDEMNAREEKPEEEKQE